MAEAGGAGGPARRDALDLGWCVGSAVMPRKQHAIEGVGAASILTLQAQLYRTQARAARRCALLAQLACVARLRDASELL